MIRINIKSNQGKLLDLLSSLQGQEIIKEISAKAVANPIKTLTEKGFDDTKTPFGERWKDLKKPTGRRPLEGLRDFFDVRVEQNRVILTHKKDYAKYHQSGTRHIPRRQFLPDLVVPTNWQNKLSVSIKEAVNKYLKGDKSVTNSVFVEGMSE